MSHASRAPGHSDHLVLGQIERALKAGLLPHVFQRALIYPLAEDC
jgi:hypothetical protein